MISTKTRYFLVCTSLPARYLLDDIFGPAPKTGWNNIPISQNGQIVGYPNMKVARL